jgi:hypothetical protein
LKHQWSKIALVLGPVIVMASIVWEYARTNPAYGYLVEPWALRGYDMPEGWIYFAIGSGLLLLGLAVMPARAVELPYAASVVVITTVVAGILGMVLGPDSISITFNGIIMAALSLLLWIMVYRTFKSLVLPRVPALDRFLIRTLISIGTLVGIFAIIFVTVGESTVAMNPGVALFSGVGLLALFALATAPHGLAANRLLIYLSVLGGAIITLSGGALRSSLQEAQVDAIGVAAQYKDVQVSYGWFIALLGMAVVFVGAVAVWATRRDIIIARARARAQREAAEKSAQEIREAYEQYEREKAAAASSSPS